MFHLGTDEIAVIEGNTPTSAQVRGTAGVLVSTLNGGRTGSQLIGGSVEPITGIEPACSAWEVDSLPLRVYQRKDCQREYIRAGQ